MRVVPVSAIACAPGEFVVAPATENFEVENCQNPRVLLTGAHCNVPLNFVESILPNSYAPTALGRRSAVNTGSLRFGMALSKKVFCWVGATVFNLEKARPRRPLEPTSATNVEEMLVASSTACLSTETPPIVTTSVPLFNELAHKLAYLREGPRRSRELSCEPKILSKTEMSCKGSLLL